MAKIDSFFLGNISGRLGDKVYFQVRGKTYVRSVKQTSPKQATALQQQQRERFKRILRFSQKFRYSVIPLIWNGQAKSTSGFSLFMKTNAPAFVNDGQMADPKLIRLSMGKLILPKGFTVQRVEGNPNQVEVSWEKDMHLGGIPLWDELLAVSAANEQYSDIILTGITRGNLGGSVELPDLGASATHLYLFFGSYDKKKYSESVCFEI